MDGRSAFGVILVLLALGGLAALATKRLQIVNGTIVIGAPATDASTSTPASPSTSTTPATSAPAASPASSLPSWLYPFGTSSTPPAPAPTPAPTSSATSNNALAQVLGAPSATDTFSNFYDPASLFRLVSAGDGIALNPYGMGA